MRMQEGGAATVVGFHQVPPDLDVRYVVAAGTERLIHDVVRAEHGPTGVMSLRLPGWSGVTAAMPTGHAEGIAAAVAVREQAQRVAKEYVRIARGDGASWEALAVPLDVAGAEDPAAAAFAVMIAGSAADHQEVPWFCTSCEHQVVEEGPPAGDPHDREHGHARNCARHREEVARHRRGTVRSGTR